MYFANKPRIPVPAVNKGYSLKITASRTIKRLNIMLTTAFLFIRLLLFLNVTPTNTAAVHVCFTE